MHIKNQPGLPEAMTEISIINVKQNTHSQETRNELNIKHKKVDRVPASKIQPIQRSPIWFI